MHHHLLLLLLMEHCGGRALPPDYYAPRNPTVTFPRAVDAHVGFPASVSPTVRFTP